MDILTALTVMLAFLLVMSLDTPNFSKTLIERVRAEIRTFIAERSVGEAVEFRTPMLVTSWPLLLNRRC